MAKQPVISRKPRAPAAGTPVLVRLQPDALDRLDDWAARQSDKPTRPEALRRLMEHALDLFDHANMRRRK
jgi:hypothetical protein